MNIRPIRPKIRRFCTVIHDKLLDFCVYLFHCLPIKKNKIVFVKDNGKGFACNLRYVAEEIIRQGFPYDMVWLVNNSSEKMPNEIRKVRLNSIKAVYELATAHIFINNAKIPYKVVLLSFAFTECVAVL